MLKEAPLADLILGDDVVIAWWQLCGGSSIHSGCIEK